MLEDLPSIPPYVPLLVGAVAQSTSPQDARRRIKDLLPELRRQSEAYELADRSYDQDPRLFEVHLHGALDLFSQAGCQELPCRLQAADRLARSVGLIADRIWLNDTLTWRFLNFGRSTNSKLDLIVADALVLAKMAPLIASGVVRFQSSWMAICSACSEEFERQFASSADELVRLFRSEFKIHVDTNPRYISTGRCFDPPIRLALRNSVESPPTASEIAQETIYDTVRAAFWVAREASLSRGAVFSNSMLGLAALLHAEGRLTSKRSLLMMDKERELQIPWVSDLTPSQVMQLRSEAATALPAFREKLINALSVQTSASAASPVDLIADLRAQAVDVRTELERTRKKSARYWKVTYSLLGLAISAYGVMSDQVAAGVGGLLPIIQLIISHKAGHETNVAALNAKPGFVLVKAHDILAHAVRKGSKSRAPAD